MIAFNFFFYQTPLHRNLNIHFTRKTVQRGIEQKDIAYKMLGNLPHLGYIIFEVASSGE